jgi:NADH-quinone oxidoreductase subunit M
MSVLLDNLPTLLIAVPLLGAALIVMVPAARGRSGPDFRAVAIALAASAVVLALSLVGWASFRPARPGFQFRVQTDWIPDFRVRYDVGLDGVSLSLVVLTAFLTVVCVAYSARIEHRSREYMAFLLILESAMVGVFTALDLVLFYVFWELVLIPMYFLIGIWGHERRVYAAVKFFIFTFAGSVLMLVGIVYLYVVTGTFSLVDLMSAGTQGSSALAGMTPQSLMWVYAAFALAFMIKVPMFPFHTWLPDAHVEAPTAGSVILAGVLLKMGVYGFIRICLPLFPAQMERSAPLFLILSVGAVIYGAVVAAVQPDMKKLVAYSSVSHMGVVMLGVFSFEELAATGAVVQSVNHGVSTGMLFLLVGMLYDRRHTREISAFGGIRRVVPLLSALFLLAAFSSAALPLTNGFIGEYLVLQGSYLSKTSGPWYTGVAALGMVLSATYMLWLFQRAFCGPISRPENQTLKDLCRREKLVLIPLAALVLWIGCYPAPLLRLAGPVRTRHGATTVNGAAANTRSATPGDGGVSGMPR